MYDNSPNGSIGDHGSYGAQDFTVPAIPSADGGQIAGSADVPPKKPKKTKEQRRCPRKRRSKKREGADPPPSLSLHRRGPVLPVNEYGDCYSGEDDEHEDTSIRKTFSSEGHGNAGGGDSLFDPVLSSWFKEMKAKRLEGGVSAGAPVRVAVFDKGPGEAESSPFLDPGAGKSQSAYSLLLGAEDETRFFFEIQKERLHPKQLQLQQQQAVVVEEDEDYLAEQAERVRWRAWALHAAEMERRRRMRILEEIDMEQERERQARRQWAIEAIEKEKNDRISAQFLSNLTSTNWFNDAITAYHEDYELVCPYYKLGCNVYCRRSTLQQHLKKCRFAIEYTTTSQPASDDNSYEVVCPNSILGCTYTGCLKDLTKHLTECTFLGRTVQQEREERQQMMKHVIMECEEERARRVQSDEYVVTIRKNENRIPSRSGYRADSGKDDGSTAAAITREITRESLPISSEQLTNAVVNRSESQGINASQSMYRRGEEGALPLPHTIGPPPNSSTPIYELAKALEGTSSNFHTYAQSEIDSSDFSDSGIQTRSDAKKKKPSLQRLLEEQKRTIIAALHREASQLWIKVQTFRRAREDENKAAISYLNATIKEMWPFAEVRPFGSFASGLYSLSSDMDLVVCFADQYKSLPTVTGVAPLLQNLAEWLLMKASEAIVIRKVLLHSAVPIIKADVRRSFLKKYYGAEGFKESVDAGAAYGKKDRVKNLSSCNSSVLEGNDEYLSIDISIDAPSHSGVATTAFVKQMLAAYPVIGPAVCLLKTFLKSKGLGDPYSGGLSPYGLFLLVLLLKQQRETIHAPLRPAVDIASGLRSPVRSLKDGENLGLVPTALSVEMDFKKKSAVTVADLSLSPHRSLPDAEDLDLSILRIRTRSRSDAEAPKFLFPASLSQDPSAGLSPTANSIGGIGGAALANNPGIVFSPRRQQSTLTRGQSSDNIMGMKQASERPPANSRVGARSFIRSSKSRPSFLLTWNCVEQQIDFGRRVAEKLLEGRSGSMRIRGLSVSSEVERPVVSGEAGQQYLEESETTLDLSEGELGSLLIEFLEYFGEGWDNEKIGFSVRDGGFKFDLSACAGMPSHPQADDPFVIEDPVNVINNVARTCYNVNSVMRSIQEAHTRYRASVVRLGTHHKIQSGGKKKKKVEEDPNSVNGGGSIALHKEVVLETIPEVSFEAGSMASLEQLGLSKDVANTPIDAPKKGNVIRAARRIELAVASHASVDGQWDSGTSAGAEAASGGAGGPAKIPSAVAKKMDPIESVIREIFELDIGAF